MHLLSTLGTGNYQPILYKLPGKWRRKSKFFFHALDQMFNYEQIFLLVTAEAKETHGLEVAKLLGERLQFIDIPMGSSQEEMWEIFEAVAEVIPNQAKMAVDITHGFRSLAITMALISLYLRASKEVEIDNVYYGAYEARFTERGELTAPVLELHQAFEMVEWFFAARNFRKFGNIGEIGGILNDINGELYRDENQEKKPQHLQTLGRSFSSLNEAIDLARPLQINEKAQGVKDNLENARSELKQWAKPADRIYDQLEEVLDILISGDKEEFGTEEIVSQSKLVAWYGKNGRWATALSLSREVVVNCLLIHMDYTKKEELLDYSRRKSAESHLNTLSKDMENKEVDLSDDIEELLGLWGDIRGKRNNIAHHGFNQDSQNVTIRGIQNTLERFQNLIIDPAWSDLAELK